jgi:hypothetical protein
MWPIDPSNGLRHVAETHFEGFHFHKGAVVDSLAELLEDELKDIYSAENQLLKALHKMAKKATSPKLK